VKRTLLVATIIALVTAACGGDDGGSQDAARTRTVEIDMVDTAFEPGALPVGRGEKVRFLFHNRGKVPHDAFIGDPEEQAEHQGEMRKAEGGHHMSGRKNAVTVKPGKTGALTRTFNEAGTVEIGCHQPGHYAAGMRITVTVV
jgi:uncharacterized cupredoxin-like copper-binding protein